MDGTNGASVPAAIGQQLDQAWTRDMAVLDGGACGTLDGRMRRDLHDAIFVLMRSGPILYKGQRYYGLTWVDQDTSEVAMLAGRVPAAAHEMWHLIAEKLGAADGDAGHTGPCWEQVNGDTAE